MRIGINVTWMAPGQAGGMEWYIRNLIRELIDLDRQHRWVLVTSPDNEHLFEPRSRRWKRVTYRGQDNTPESFAVRPHPDPAAAPPRLRGWWSGRGRRSWAPGLNELIRHERLDLW